MDFDTQKDVQEQNKAAGETKYQAFNIKQMFDPNYVRPEPEQAPIDGNKFMQSKIDGYFAANFAGFKNG